MQTGIIYTQIPRADATLVEEARKYAVSDLHEALGVIVGRMGLMSSRMRPIAPGQRMAGQAVTAFNYPGDNLMIHKALHLAEAGDVLVLTNGGSEHGALWGDVAATFAKHKGIAGVVADGPVRDVDALREMQFFVWSTSVSPSHPEKRGPGSVNVPVICDGVLVNPGDVLVGDADGVLVIPLQHLRTALDGARQRSEREAAVRRRTLAGESLYEVLDMQRQIDGAGIREHQGIWSE
jgi:4-hydroxy-4-methyl-2-oxoglutarate aldolase